MKELNNPEQGQTEKLEQKQKFINSVKGLTHDHERKYYYISSYKIDENKTLTLFYQPSHTDCEVEIPSSYTAFFIKRITWCGYEINVRESYQANGYIGIRYGESIASYRKIPKENDNHDSKEFKKIKLKDDEGEPGRIYSMDSVPEEVKKALLYKFDRDEINTEEEKIKAIIELMSQISEKQRIEPKRGHIHWPWFKKHKDKKSHLI